AVWDCKPSQRMHLQRRLRSTTSEAAFAFCRKLRRWRGLFGFEPRLNHAAMLLSVLHSQLGIGRSLGLQTFYRKPTFDIANVSFAGFDLHEQSERQFVYNDVRIAQAPTHAPLLINKPKYETKCLKDGVKR